jgi:hypothetical protein
VWEKPYISIFIEIGAFRNFTHFGSHLLLQPFMVAILAAIFNMVAKTHKKVLQCSNYKENCYLGVFRGM